MKLLPTSGRGSGMASHFLTSESDPQAAYKVMYNHQVACFQIDDVGSVLDLDIMGLHRQAKLIVIDKQPNDNIVHQNRCGETDRFAPRAIQVMLASKRESVKHWTIRAFT